MVDAIYAQKAFNISEKYSGTPPERQSFICSYQDCNSYAQHLWGRVFNSNSMEQGRAAITRKFSSKQVLVTAYCEACERESLFVDEVLVYPQRLNAPAAAADLPADIARDFEEARAIIHKSPRGAAALLRLAVEKLCKEIGTSKTDINGAIGELVSTGRISATVQQALDSVRVIGNESVHPGFLDLRDDEATVIALFNLINFIVHKTITEPKEVAAIYASPPQPKLDGIIQRDSPKAPPP